MSRTRQSSARETEVRDDVRLAPGEAMGRNGKIVRRSSVTDDGNKYFVPEEIVAAHLEEGFTLEWKRVEVLGKTQDSYIAQTARGGWEPVMAERWPGRFLPEGQTGAIVVDGLMLMERPQVLTDEAIREDKANARNAANAQRDKLGIKGLPAGYEDPNQNKGAALQRTRFVRQTIEPVEGTKPKYNYSDVAID
jgi:hypothetical protein